MHRKREIRRLFSAARKSPATTRSASRTSLFGRSASVKARRRSAFSISGSTSARTASSGVETPTFNNSSILSKRS
ncbi:hypothetical protein [Novosphingobium sp. FSW06-99]|uniref:hypothetical protein n=1 Tax=Novosphingobium sp. FSW06-99 TaxID=1739113 RepID=UPI003514A385